MIKDGLFSVGKSIDCDVVGCLLEGLDENGIIFLSMCMEKNDNFDYYSFFKKRINGEFKPEGIVKKLEELELQHSKSPQHQPLLKL